MNPIKEGRSSERTISSFILTWVWLHCGHREPDSGWWVFKGMIINISTSSQITGLSLHKKRWHTERFCFRNFVFFLHIFLFFSSCPYIYKCTLQLISPYQECNWIHIHNIMNILNINLFVTITIILSVATQVK